MLGKAVSLLLLLQCVLGDGTTGKEPSCEMPKEIKNGEMVDEMNSGDPDMVKMAKYKCDEDYMMMETWKGDMGWCRQDGTYELPRCVTKDEWFNVEFELDSGTSITENAGRLKARHVFADGSKGDWFAGCDDHFNNPAAGAICRTMGFRYGRQITPDRKMKPIENLPFGKTNIYCNHDDTLLTSESCNVDDYDEMARQGSPLCSPDEQATVQCFNDWWKVEVDFDKFEWSRLMYCHVKVIKEGYAPIMSYVHVKWGGIIDHEMTYLKEEVDYKKEGKTHYSHSTRTYRFSAKFTGKKSDLEGFFCDAFLVTWYGLRKLGSSTNIITYEITTKRIEDRTIFKDHTLQFNTIDGDIKPPVIHAVNGIWVSFKVQNEIVSTNESDFGLSIHWHGLNMKGAQMFDGVVGLTQCPIATGNTYNYFWKVNEEPGTYWYHTHDRKMAPTGQYDFIKGPLIIHESIETVPSQVEQQRHPYQNGKDIILFYTMHNYTYKDENKRDHYKWVGYLNGERYDEQKTVAEITTFKVENGEYRFRIINGVGSSNSAFFFQIDGHKLKVVATDGYPVEPYETDVIQVSIAERYDVVVNFCIENTAESFWIRAITNMNKQTEGRVLGIVQVRSCKKLLYLPLIPRITRKNDTIDFTKVKVLNCLKSTGCTNGALVTVLTPSPKVKDPKLLDKFSYHTYDIEFDGANKKFIWKISLDNKKFHQNHIPCESGLLESAKHGWDDRTNVLHLRERKTVTIVIRNTTPERHPMHMHGHHFEVLEINTGKQNTKTKLNGTQECYGTLRLHHYYKEKEEKEEELEEGKSPFYAFSEPIEELMATKKIRVLKDTIFLPPCGAVALRINSDNPGVWFFHCHIDFHLHHGLAVVLNENDYLFSQPKLPKDYPSCGVCKD